ncbi:MAG: Gfo/Idh/MocA family oxidoreductase [Methylacidiphilales bacterium]|nr:Gfo/Idh/MocA family oxidoreductase [Candidatus Methylacidiphilales bacterium]
MKKLRLGIIGLGNMGTTHSHSILQNQSPRCELAAVADLKPEHQKKFPQVDFFRDGMDLIQSGKCDAVLIATPHYSHTTLGIAALKAGLHVLVEKPISVHKADCERLIKAHTNKKQVFAAMFNQRTDPYYIKLRNLIRSGELGKLRRVQWTITNWFRSHAYYDSGGWRATWGGEGGGTLLNQCPHNLDLWQWMFGMPKRIRAFCTYGRYHKIEVEDDVTAYLEYADGMTGVWIASTGEAPGTNRLEVVGENGRIVYENDQLRFLRNETPMGEFSRTTKEFWSVPETWDVLIPCKSHGGQHVEIINNFAAAILDKGRLIAPAAEGIHSVELANAMLLSSARAKTIELPMKSAVYEKWLKGMIANSKIKKKEPRNAHAVDIGKSFGNRPYLNP